VRGLSLCLAVAVAACGANTATNDFTNPITACRSFANSVCTRESQCNPGTVNVSSCEQLLATAKDCNQASCGTNNYSGTAAQQCNNDYLNQSCTDSNAGNNPASCAPSLVCPAPDAGP
jgi:hypothetical protein